MNVAYSNKEDLLANIPNSVTATFGRNPNKSATYQMGLFFQDDWRVTPKLVLNLGAAMTSSPKL